MHDALRRDESDGALILAGAFSVVNYPNAGSGRARCEFRVLAVTLRRSSASLGNTVIWGNTLVDAEP